MTGPHNGKPRLTAVMACAIADILDHGGRIHRHATGQWTEPSAAKPFLWHVADDTVQALIRRVELVVMQRDMRGHAIAAKVNSKYAGAMEQRGCALQPE